MESIMSQLNHEPTIHYIVLLDGNRKHLTDVKSVSITISLTETAIFVNDELMKSISTQADDVRQKFYISEIIRPDVFNPDNRFDYCLDGGKETGALNITIKPLDDEFFPEIIDINSLQDKVEFELRKRFMHMKALEINQQNA
jgi:hypothetical protein